MANISYSITDFLAESEDRFIGKLSTQHAMEHVDLTGAQNRAWKKEFQDLQRILQNKNGQILFEYSIPSLPKAIDVVLLIEGKIFVLEYKTGEDSFRSQDIHQTNGYALRLKYFHSKSNDNWIIPILVATDANDGELVYTPSEDDMVYNTIQCNSNNLCNAIEYILSKISYEGTNDWEREWEYGIFKASPTIIEAARNVWRANNVRGFTISEATKETRLAAEDYIVNQVVPNTRDRSDGKRKSICFVTGVPGAGKTLVGLNISVKLQDYGASMLSGNGPLVAVLTTALKRDLDNNQDNLTHPKDKISVETIIRNAYGYKKEIFDNRLSFIKESGTVHLKDGANPGSQHVIIFDEAQRAWNKDKLIKPGRNGKKDWQEETFPFSEPGLLLWDMNQRDWGVFVCLVGGGQEINTGEAGICEWLKAIKDNRDFDNWHIYMSKELLGEEYNSRTGDEKTLSDYKNYFESLGRLTVDDSLHLTACQRTNRSDKVAEFIQELLECNAQRAKKLYEQFKNKYQIYLTRNTDTAKEKLRQRKSQLLDRTYIDGINNESIRIGMLMSSKAARLRPLGFEIKKVADYLQKVPNWFLNPPDYVESSDFLDIALNEFFVQGLELDFTAVMWDADFRYNDTTKQWDFYDFNGRYWGAVNKDCQETKRFYMKNAYRVLLTRARAGMVIVVPEGNPADSTRKAEFYDCTYNYLKSIGLEVL